MILTMSQHFTLPVFERDVQPVPDSLGSGVHAPASEVLSSSTVPQTVQLGLGPEHHLRSQECQLIISGFQLSTPFLTSRTCTLSSASTSTATTTPSTYSLMLRVKGVDGTESSTSPDPSIREVSYGTKSDSRGPVTMTRAGPPSVVSIRTGRSHGQYVCSLCCLLTGLCRLFGTCSHVVGCLHKDSSWLATWTF